MPRQEKFFDYKGFRYRLSIYDNGDTEVDLISDANRAAYLQTPAPSFPFTIDLMGELLSARQL